MQIAELMIVAIIRSVIAPEQFGIARADIAALTVRDAQESAATLLAVLNDHAGPARDIVVRFAGAAIYVAGLAANLGAGMERARAVIASGAARDRLARLTALTQTFQACARRGPISGESWAP